MQGKPVLQHKSDSQWKRQILSAKQLKMLLKKKEPVFLAILREIDDSKRRQGGRNTLALGAAHVPSSDRKG